MSTPKFGEQLVLVTICLPTIRAGSVQEAIDAIRQQTSPNWELIVVPQGPDPEMIRVLDEYVAADSRIRYVHVDMMNASNARNVAMQAAHGDVFAFTDDDCEVAPNWVEVMIDELTAHPTVGVIGGEVVAPKSEQPWRISTCPAAHVLDAVYYPQERNHRAPDGFYMIGANIAVRREAAERIGLFDVILGAGAYFACCEDQDIIVRAEALDIGLMTTKRLVVNHTTGRRYGVKQFLKHQRNYALGRGAWITKLQMWNHRLGDEWSRPETFRSQAKQFFTQPHRWVFNRYGNHYKKIGAARYRAMYELGDDVLSHPRGTSGAVKGSDLVRRASESRSS